MSRLASAGVYIVLEGQSHLKQSSSTKRHRQTPTTTAQKLDKMRGTSTGLLAAVLLGPGVLGAAFGVDQHWRDLANVNQGRSVGIVSFHRPYLPQNYHEKIHLEY